MQRGIDPSVAEAAVGSAGPVEVGPQIQECADSVPSQPARGQTVFEVIRYGAVPDDDRDDTQAVIAALAAARDAKGGVVQLPRGTLVVRPPSQFSALGIGTDTWIRGHGRESVLRVGSNTGSYQSVFSAFPGPTAYVHDVVLSDFRVQQDCGASGGYLKSRSDGNRFAVLLFYRAKRVRVERMTFDDACGVNTVVVNGASVRDVSVQSSYFRFAKGPTPKREREYDNTAVYLHGANMKVCDNRFETTFDDDAYGAIEMHGESGLAARNTTKRYRSCVRIVSAKRDEQDPPDNRFVVTGNHCEAANDAINVWSATGHRIKGVAIDGNVIRVAAARHRLASHRAISLTWETRGRDWRGAVEDITITANTITFEADRGRRYSRDTSGGIVLQSAGALLSATIQGNVVRNTSGPGILVRTRGTSAASGLHIVGNHIALQSDGDDDAVPGIAILAEGELHDLRVERNTVALPRERGDLGQVVRVNGAAGSTNVLIRGNTAIIE
jgi:hypothetical protein